MKLKRYWLCSLVGILLASFYPLYMGISVLAEYLANGSVAAENYPKYIIPYTPISLALIVGTALLYIAVKSGKKYAQAVLSALSVAVFFAFEFLLENLVIVTTTVKVTLESWQMYLCIATPLAMQTETVESLLGGEYSPAMKLHFYMISVVLILAAINCFFGFGQMLQSGDCRRKKPLILQTVATVLFFALCVLACFTAFFRTGEILVSPLSAWLMGIFFVVLGVTVGMYAASFLQQKPWALSVLLPAVLAAAATAAMYIGEMILLGGELYRFGSGILFERLGALALAPIDLLIILLSGAFTALIANRSNRE